MSRFYDPNTLEGRLRQKIVFLKNKLVVAGRAALKQYGFCAA
jgi:hypothetical protein